MLLVCVVLAILSLVSGDRKNVLFLVVDDLRPQLGCYEGEHFPSPTQPKMHTPNIDDLARKSLLMTRGYVQWALCAPSRTSVLTGRRPDTTHIYNLHKYWRNEGGNFTTIPQYFKEHGYNTIGMGKIFHPGASSGDKDPISWSDGRPTVDFSRFGKVHNADHKIVYAVPDSEIKDHPMGETVLADHAIDTLKKVSQKAKSGQQNFFVAVGFHKPHLPWTCPERYLQYYPKQSIRVPENMHPPKNLPPVAWHDFNNMGTHSDMKGLHNVGQMGFSFPDDKVIELRRGYYTCVSWIDDEVGRILKALKDEGLENNTIVSFWGDHGWALGENGEWEKQTNFEVATHIPYMIRVPGLTDRGIKTDKLTEMVDLFPTLVEAAELPKLQTCPEDSHKVKACTEGDSLVPLMKHPNHAKWKSAAFSQYSHHLNGVGGFMGYSMRTDRYRYTEWVEFDYTQHKPNWNKMNAAELYDHQTDPWENDNKANDPNLRDVRQQLSKALHSGWRQAREHGSASIIG